MVDSALVVSSFSLGMAAFFSPCGFPMLPAYVAYYLGVESRRNADVAGRDLGRNLARGLAGGTLAGLGAFAVIAAVALLAATVGRPFKERVLLLELGGGLIVIALGILMLAGRDFSFAPRVKAIKGRGFLSLFAFGALYAAVAAGCVAPIFIGVVTISLEGATFLDRFLNMAAYGAGLGILLVGLTVAVSVVGQGVVTRLNAVLPYVKRAGGVVMVLMGTYLVLYWAWVEQYDYALAREMVRVLRLGGLFGPGGLFEQG